MATPRRSEFKAYAESIGIDWRDVAAMKAEIRAQNVAWVKQVKAIKARCRTLGIKRHAISNANGERDQDSIFSFDTIARTISHEFPFLNGENAAAQLFELLSQADADLELNAEQCFERAINHLEMLQINGRYQPTAGASDDDVPF
jgi:hypothetical protein